jgi:hypothetical protein
VLALDKGAARAAAMRATLAAGGLTQVGGGAAVWLGGWAWHDCVACAWHVHGTCITTHHPLPRAPPPYSHAHSHSHAHAHAHAHSHSHAHAHTHEHD